MTVDLPKHDLSTVVWK